LAAVAQPAAEPARRADAARLMSEPMSGQVASVVPFALPKVPMASGGDTIDHTAYTYVLDTEGRYVGHFPPGTSGARMAAFVRTLVPPGPPGR
jgi:hypothetical protein